MTTETVIETTPTRRRPDGSNKPEEYLTMNDIEGKGNLNGADDGLVRSSGATNESHVRSIVKGITWRVLATSTTTIIAWLVTGQLDAAFQIGLFEFVAKLFIYYVHERIWTRIKI